jgi:uncharacterized protein YqhQ
MQVLRISKRTDVRIKFVLLIFFGLFYVLAIPYPEKSRQFPQLIALFSLAAIVASLIGDLMGKATVTAQIAQVDDTELTHIDEREKKDKKKRFYQAWGIILGSLAAGLLGGFLFTTLFLFAGFALIFGQRKNIFKNMVVAVVMTICIYFVFEWLMSVPLLSGLFW